MTRRTITLNAKPTFKHKYHFLLRKEWSMATHLQTLNLLDELLQASRAELQFALEKRQPSPRRGTILLGLPELEDLHKILALFNLAEQFAAIGIPALPEKLAELPFRAPRNRVAATAVRTLVYLNLQALFDLRGETGFCRDLQSLLFLHTVEWLLPQLRPASTRNFTAFVVHAPGTTSSESGPTIRDITVPSCCMGWLPWRPWA